MTTKICNVEIEIDYEEIINELDYRELGENLDYSQVEISYGSLAGEISHEELANEILYKLERFSGEELLKKIVEKVSERVATILTEREKKSEEKVTQVREQLATLLEALK